MLTRLEEDAIKKWAEERRQQYETPNEMDLRSRANLILANRGIDRMPGKKWVRGFLERTKFVGRKAPGPRSRRADT